MSTEEKALANVEWLMAKTSNTHEREYANAQLSIIMNRRNSKEIRDTATECVRVSAQYFRALMIEEIVLARPSCKSEKWYVQWPT